MSSRFNGYRQDERPPRPSSEQLVDLHVYLVPPDIWREKFNNALNQNINDTVSLGFIRVDPETKITTLRDEIEQQLGSDLVPRDYVFLKSVGRSLTREPAKKPEVLSHEKLDKFVDLYVTKVKKLKSRQENQLKAKHFLPPQAYAPELYLLEATPEVRAVFAASSEGSTRPQTRTSYDYNPFSSQSEDPTFQHGKYGSNPHGNNLPTRYSPLPQITSRSQRDAPRLSQRSQSPSQTYQSSHRYPQNSHPAVVRTSPSPREPIPHKDSGRTNGYDKISHVPQQADWDDPFNEQTVNSYNNQNSYNQANFHKPRHNDTHSDRAYQDYHQPVASSPRRVPAEQPQEEEYLQPLSATPPQSPEPEGPGNRRDRREKKPQNNEDSGIAGFTPDAQIYKENQDDVLDRRKQQQENHELNDRLRPLSPGEKIDDQSPNAQTSRENLEALEWERQRKEEQEREKREQEERKRQEEEERKREEENRAKIAEEAKLLKTKSDEDLTRYPSPPPLRLASPDRDTQSAKERRRREKEELLKELEDCREARQAAERHREELVKQAKQMQNKTQNRRNHARDIWKKRYFEEKKKTGPFEEQCNRLRHELDIIHKRLLTTLEGPKEKATKLQDIKPANKVGLATGTVSEDNTAPSQQWVPHQAPGSPVLARSPVLVKIGSPRGVRSPMLSSSPTRRRNKSPERKGSHSPERKVKVPYKLTSKDLDKVNRETRKPGTKQYPIALMGSGDKQKLLESQLFYDSDFESPTPPNRSPYHSGVSRGYESPRKSVQFEKKVDVIPQEGS